MSNEDQLVLQSLSGDEDAFREIVETYKAYIFAIILNFVKEQDEAENIAQDVFLQIYRSLPQFRFKNLKSWIGKITVTRAIDWKRKNKKREREKLYGDDSEIYRVEGSNLITPGLTPAFSGTGFSNPEDIFLKKEKRTRVKETCERLPALYKSVMMKFYLEGKSYQDIATEESTTVKTIESRLYRARNLFREKWGEDD